MLVRCSCATRAETPNLVGTVEFMYKLHFNQPLQHAVERDGVDRFLGSQLSSDLVVRKWTGLLQEKRQYRHARLCDAGLSLFNERFGMGVVRH